MSIDAVAMGKRLSQLRKQNKLTQTGMSNTLLISRSYLSRLEIGMVVPSLDLLCEIALRFHVSLDYLILGKNEENTAVRPELHNIIESLNQLEKKI